MLSHVTLDGTLIETDRVNERNDHGHHLWCSGKQDPGRQRADPRRPRRVPGVVQRGRTGQHTRHHRRSRALPGALYKAAADGLPTLTDKGYAGAGIGVHSPVNRTPDMGWVWWAVQPL